MAGPFSTPEILVSLTPCPEYGLTPWEQQRQLLPSERWVVPLTSWDDARSYIEELGFMSLSEFIAQREADFQMGFDDPEYLNALILPRTDATIAAIRRQLSPTFEVNGWHCPLLFGEPWYLGPPDEPPTLVSLMCKFERYAHQFAFFQVRVLSHERVFAVRHPARLLIARNEATGEHVQCWHDTPKLCIAKILTDTDEAIAAINQVSEQNATFLQHSVLVDS